MSGSTERIQDVIKHANQTLGALESKWRDKTVTLIKHRGTFKTVKIETNWERFTVFMKMTFTWDSSYYGEKAAAKSLYKDSGRLFELYKPYCPRIQQYKEGKLSPTEAADLLIELGQDEGDGEFLRTTLEKLNLLVQDLDQVEEDAMAVQEQSNEFAGKYSFPTNKGKAKKTLGEIIHGQVSGIAFTFHVEDGSFLKVAKERGIRLVGQMEWIVAILRSRKEIEHKSAVVRVVVEYLALRAAAQTDPKLEDALFPPPPRGTWAEVDNRALLTLSVFVSDLKGWVTEGVGNKDPKKVKIAIAGLIAVEGELDKQVEAIKKFRNKAPKAASDFLDALLQKLTELQEDLAGLSRETVSQLNSISTELAESIEPLKEKELQATASHNQLEEQHREVLQTESKAEREARDLQSQAALAEQKERLGLAMLAKWAREQNLPFDGKDALRVQLLDALVRCNQDEVSDYLGQLELELPEFMLLKDGQFLVHDGFRQVIEELYSEGRVVKTLTKRRNDANDKVTAKLEKADRIDRSLASSAEEIRKLAAQLPNAVSLKVSSWNEEQLRGFSEFSIENMQSHLDGLCTEEDAETITKEKFMIAYGSDFAKNTQAQQFLLMIEARDRYQQFINGMQALVDQVFPAGWFSSPPLAEEISDVGGKRGPIALKLAQAIELRNRIQERAKQAQERDYLRGEVEISQETSAEYSLILSDLEGLRENFKQVAEGKLAEVTAGQHIQESEQKVAEAKKALEGAKAAREQAESNLRVFKEVEATL